MKEGSMLKPKSIAYMMTTGCKNKAGIQNLQQYTVWFTGKTVQDQTNQDEPKEPTELHRKDTQMAQGRGDGEGRRETTEQSRRRLKEEGQHENKNFKRKRERGILKYTKN